MTVNIDRMVPKLLKMKCFLRIILVISVLSTAILIWFSLLSEFTLPLLPLSVHKKSSKKLPNNLAVTVVIDKITAKSSAIPQIVSYTEMVNSTLDSQKGREVEKKQSRGHDDVRKRSREYCDIMEQSTYSRESIPTVYKLSAVAVVVRHGERTPLYKFLNHRLPKKLSCNFSHIIGNKSFGLDVNKNNENGTSKTNLLWQKFRPNDHACLSGQLTSRGFLQMIQLGKHFRKAYFNDKDFSQSVSRTSPSIYVRSTEYGRTVQSAFGFLSGLLKNKDFETVQLRFDQDVYFCSNSIGKFGCNCPAANRLNSVIEKNLKKTSGIVDAQERQIKLKVANIFHVSVGQIPWIGAMLEVFMSRICLGMNPPCWSNSYEKGHCVTWSLINRMWDFSDNFGKLHLNSSTEESFSLLSIYPMLHDIVHHFLNVSNYSTHKNSTRFFIFSGHDKTVLAIMKALKIYDGRWPSFAAQVTFELYSHRNKQFYIRVLYNGNDLTKQVRFCRDLRTSHSLCPFENFVYYILYEVHQLFQTKSYNEMCR